MSNYFVKDPQAVLDYVFDWAALTNGTGTTDWLASGETISTKTVTVSSGLTVDSSSIINTNTAVKVWLSSGTAGSQYTVACKVTTSASRTDERTITIDVRNR
jgi:hypothetical protein